MVGARKTAWPELVGKNGEVARKIVQASGYDVQVIPYDMMVTMEYRRNRVRIWLLSNGNVARLGLA
jgi:hypothetical protein